MPDHDIPPAGPFSPEHGNPDTEVSPLRQKPPLGVGRIFADTFSILFRHFVTIFVIGFAATALGALANIPLINASFYRDATDFYSLRFTPPDKIIISTLPLIVLEIATYAGTAAFLVRLTYGAKLKRPEKFRRLVRPAFSSFFVLTALGIVVGVILLGSFRLTLFFGELHGLYLRLAFPVGSGLLSWFSAPVTLAVPAIVIEKANLLGLGRSIALTRNYRWAITGTLFLSLIFVLFLLTAFSFLVVLIETGVGKIAFIALAAALNGLIAGFLCLVITLIYVRMREIKEGIGVDRIDTVFD